MCFKKDEKQIVQIKFGVPYFDVFDSRFSDFGVPVSVRGAVNFQIKSYKKLVQTYGYGDIPFEEFKTKIKTAIIGYVKNYVIDLPQKHNISVFQIERNILDVAELLKLDLTTRLKKEFKLSLGFVDITNIEIDKTSDGYHQLKAITQDVTTTIIQAQTDVTIKNLLDKQRIEAENYQATLQIERENLKNDNQIQKLKKTIILISVLGGIAIIALLLLLLL